MRADFEVRAERGEGDERVVEVAVPHDLVYFQGHFEGAPMLPGVAQVVALADANARRVFAGLGANLRLSRLKFQAVARPGDALTLRLSAEPWSDVAAGSGSEGSGSERLVRFRLEREGAPISAGTLAYAAPT